jgi:voltage-gated potassium channel
MNNHLGGLGLDGVDSRDAPEAVHAWRWMRWVLFAFSLLAIPAFYVELTAPSPLVLVAGRALYFSMFAGFAASLAWMVHLSRKPKKLLLRNRLDAVIMCGAAASIGWGGIPWQPLEWVLRLSFMGIVALRIVFSLRRFFAPNRVPSLLMAGAAVLALAGAGFDWLEPKVHSYADGLWLAFESSATVGYGDLAPTTPASRVFAVFVVLLGYGMLSLVFASIAAMFIGQEEKALRREMHRDIKRLQDEMALLHRDLNALRDVLARQPRVADGDIREESGEAR